MIAAAVTFLVCSAGALANASVLICSRQLSSMSSSFGVITKYIAICNVSLCLVFLMCVFPLQLNSDSQFLLNYSHFSGLLAMIFYQSSNQAHLLIALNRFCATFLPHLYAFLFTELSTALMSIFTFILSTAICTVFFELLMCQFVFDPNFETFHFVFNARCESITWYSDFVFNLTLVASALFINLITALKVAMESRKLMNAVGLRVSPSQKRREINFVKQTFLQGVIVFLGQITFYIMTPFLQNKLAVFVLATLWAFMQAFEGFIILLSNRDIRNKALRRKITASDRVT